MKMTIKEAKLILSVHGQRLTRKDGEYGVRDARCKNKDHGYYTEDLDDAVETGKAQAKGGFCCEVVELRQHLVDIIDLVAIRKQYGMVWQGIEEEISRAGLFLIDRSPNAGDRTAVKDGLRRRGIE